MATWLIVWDFWKKYGPLLTIFFLIILLFFTLQACGRYRAQRDIAELRYTQAQTTLAMLQEQYVRQQKSIVAKDREIAEWVKDYDQKISDVVNNPPADTCEAAVAYAIKAAQQR